MRRRGGGSLRGLGLRGEEVVWAEIGAGEGTGV